MLPSLLQAGGLSRSAQLSPAETRSFFPMTLNKVLRGCFTRPCAIWLHPPPQTHFRPFSASLPKLQSRWDSLYLLKYTQGLPGGAVAENLPANAGDTGSSPGLGGSHMPRSSWAREPQLLSLRVWSLCSATGEAAIVRGPRTAMKSGLRSPRLERALAQK